MRKNDINYGFNLYNQLVNGINKDYIDQTIFIKLHNKMRYLKRRDEHIINDIYKDEVSVMKVKRTYIIVNSNKNYTEFFEILKNINDDLFVCDFVNKDYFFITSIKTLV